MNQSSDSSPLFNEIKYCIRCCMPETQEGISFDDLGICKACQSSEQKIHINWVEREIEFRKIVERAKACLLYTSPSPRD